MARTPVSFGEIGKPGLTAYSGIVMQEFLSQLQGKDGIKVYQEMGDNNPIVSAMLFNITQLLKRSEWKVVPGTDDNQGELLAEYVRTVFFEDMDLSWFDFIDNCLTFLQFGWAWFEMVFKYRKGFNKNPSYNSRYNDGMVGIRKLALRAQSTLYKWDIDTKTGDINGMIQSAPPDYRQVLIPMEKSLLFRTTTRYNNPEGRSVLRGAYRPYYFQKKLEELEAIGVERNNVGVPVAEVPAEITVSSATDEQKEQYEGIQKLTTRIRKDEQMGIVWPQQHDENGNKLYELYLLGHKGGSSVDFDTDKIIKRYDTRIAMTLLSDFILLGHERVGSFALSKNKTHLFSIALEGFLHSIAGPINNIAVPALLRYNGYNDIENPPKLVPGVIDTPDLEELGSYIANLSKAGIILGDESDKEYYREVARMPEKKIDETEGEVSDGDDGTGEKKDTGNAPGGNGTDEV